MCLISPMPFVITYARFKNYCDFLSPFVYTPFNILIPVPAAQFALGGSISSVWKPFETTVSSEMHQPATPFLSKYLCVFKQGVDCAVGVYCCNDGIEHYQLVVQAK